MVVVGGLWFEENCTVFVYEASWFTYFRQQMGYHPPADSQSWQTNTREPLHCGGFLIKYSTGFCPHSEEPYWVPEVRKMDPKNDACSLIQPACDTQLDKTQMLIAKEAAILLLNLFPGPSYLWGRHIPSTSSAFPFSVSIQLYPSLFSVLFFWRANLCFKHAQLLLCFWRTNRSIGLTWPLPFLMDS